MTTKVVPRHTDLDVFGTDAGGGASTEPPHSDISRFGDTCHGGHPVIVGVENRDTSGAHGFDEFGLGLQRRFHSAETARVGHPDHEDDADIGMDETGETRDLTGACGAEFTDEEPRLFGDAQHRQRGADLVVERRARRDGLPLVLQDPGEEVLRRRLAVGAGDADDAESPARSHPRNDLTSKVRESIDDIGDDDLADSHVDAVIDQREHGAGIGRSPHEAVTVGDLARLGDEDVARGDIARVRVDGARHDGLGAVAGGEFEGPGDGVCHLSERHPDHGEQSLGAVCRVTGSAGGGWSSNLTAERGNA